MAMIQRDLAQFPNVQTCGQLLPTDTLHRILLRDREMGGLKEEDYHLAGEQLNEAINRSWQKMLAVWRGFVKAREALAPSEKGTHQVREKLMLPLFNELGYGRLSPARPEDRVVTLPDGSTMSYAISHFRDESPVHLVGCRLSLDSRVDGAHGAARQSPHSLVQEFLNRSDNHLWGFVSNGLILRILRDNASLSRQAYVEFNLEGIFSDDSYSEFALLWLCCHHSRVHTDGKKPEECWLELWCRQAQNAAVAALDTLRTNVSNAIEIFGQGFIEANPALRQKLASGALDKQDYFRQLLRLAYRLIFLFVVEERNILHAPDASVQACERYDRYWSLSRLRTLATQIYGSRHHDLWEGVRKVMHALHGPDPCPFLGLAPMGGFLWSSEAVPDLVDLKLSNTSLLNAIRKLAFTTYAWSHRPVAWRHLGAQELGSIYESLLELQPELENGSFTLQFARGNDRKTTGSYYTPGMLIESLLETALDPVIEQAVQSEHPEQTLLDLKVCDPACGSGHFLLAAAHRIAKRLASLRTGDGEPSPQAQHAALRDVVTHCLYGVDINPMSVELCRVGLWLETYEPGKPLSFLDHRILCGNSLMGTTAEAIANGFPVETYKALLGDDNKAASALKKANCSLRKTQKLGLFSEVEQIYQNVINAVQPLKLENLPAETIEGMQERARAWRNWQSSPAWQRKKILYDMWTAAFVLPRYFLPNENGRTYPDGTPILSTTPFGVTWNSLLRVVDGEPLSAALTEAVDKAAREYQFFHFEVMFPEVADKGGFDVILGNPPWEQVEMKEQEWFTAHNCPDIAKAPNAAARRKRIAQLEETDPCIFRKWLEDSRKQEGFSHYLRNSGLYPFCGLGRINLYSVFAEKMRSSLNDNGRLGCIVPSGIASDDTTKFFFRDMVEKQSLFSLYDFENKGIFSDVHSSYKFCLLTAGSGAKALAPKAFFVFFAHTAEDLRDQEKRFTLSAADFRLLNPNTLTCPIFRTTKDAELTKAVYCRVPILFRQGNTYGPEDNTWPVRFGTMFNMATDSNLFRTHAQLTEDGWELQGNRFVKEEECCLPLYEAKMFHHFNHRWATYDIGEKGKLETRAVTSSELSNPAFSVLPRYWVHDEEVQARLSAAGWNHKWLMGWRDICRATDERTLIGGLFPVSGVGHTCPLVYLQVDEATYFYGMITSFIADFCSRQKLGGTHLSYPFMYQLPILPKQIFETCCPWNPAQTLADWLRPRIVELIYTAEDMRPFAEDMGYDCAPFAWNEERRASLRAELDAAFFHLYLPAKSDGTWQHCARETEEDFNRLAELFPTPRDAVEYIMETFPIKKKHDLEAFGRYKTKEDILNKYDEFLSACR